MDLVEENMARLTVQREVHEENTENLAERTVKRHGLDRSYDGELMRRYELRYKTVLDRTIATYDGVRRKDSRGEEERGTPERRVPILDADRGGDAGDRNADRDGMQDSRCQRFRRVRAG